MPMLHGFACKILNFPHPATPVLARPEALHAPALKAPPEAGRRGGESIARKHWRAQLFSKIENATESARFIYETKLALWSASEMMNAIGLNLFLWLLDDVIEVFSAVGFD